MDYLLPVLTGISLSACTGFRAFLPPFLIGLVLRFSPALGSVLPGAQFLLQAMVFPGLQFLAQTPVLVALGVATAVEFAGDKIPWVDHLLDLLSLPVKMLFTAVLTFSLIPSGDAAWFFLLVGLVLNEGATVTTHTGKAAVRAASTATTGGAGNPVIGLIEDVMVTIGTILSLVLPVLAVLILGWAMYRSLRFLFGKRGGNAGKIAQAQPSYVYYWFARWGSWLLFTLYNRMTVRGAEHFPAQGPLVVVSNHASALDGFVLGGCSPLPIHIMVKREAFDNPISGWFLRKTLAFPVDRSKADPTAIKTSIRVLQEKRVLGLFPEGTRNPAGKVRPFKPGAIRLAVKQKVPILPAFIDGNHLMSPPHTFLPRPAKLQVAFGPLIDVPALLAQGKTEQQIQDFLYQEVTALGQALRGEDVRDFSAEPPDEGESPAPAGGLSPTPPAGS
ncbi:MAG: 1-acylglycerol-3-phosphate O-acyltransferase [Candidatus Riflebacteria bacterium]|nr:1-acylglycerol-3-phosphate O-acyltransferase [Candidatus Riflebacteria bacterium]